jgi:hypothetical protein
MRTTKLPRIENVFSLLKRKIFVAYGSWNINIAREGEHRAAFLKREEKLVARLAQLAFRPCWYSSPIILFAPCGGAV